MTVFKPIGTDQHRISASKSELDRDSIKFASDQIANVLAHSRSSSFKMMLVDERGGFNTIEVPKYALDLLRVALLNPPNEDQKQIKKDTLSTQEAADLLKVSRPFIVSQIEKGNLKCSFVGKFRRVTYEEVMRYREEQMKLS